MVTDMTLDDPRIRHEPLQGEEVYVPSTDAWLDILRQGHLDSRPCPMPDWVKHWLDDYSSHPVAALGLVKKKKMPDAWCILPLLRISGHYFRVHFENVICEHCRQRCGPSATPDI